MRYTVTSLDICQSGFERLQNHDEFLLVAHIECDTSRDDLCGQFEEDIQAVAREASFDYDAARKVVSEFLDTVEMHHASQYVPQRSEDNDDAESGCPAFLYIRDNYQGASG